MSQKLLIVGHGFLGSNIFSVASDLEMSVTGTHRSQLDVRNIDSIEKIITNTNPDFIVNCASLTNVDEVEKNPIEAFAVNANGAQNIASLAHKKKIRLIHISTDSIFDGKDGFYKENDEPNPINIYGRSKKMGEDFVKQIMVDHVIIRTNFYGQNKDGKFLFNWILQNLQQEKTFTAFDDVIFNPLEVRNLSTMIIELMQSDFLGTIHLSSNDIISKYEFAIKIAKAFNLRTDLIKKGSIKEAHFVASRPLNTSLDNSLARRLLKTEVISLQKWLNDESRSYKD